MKSQLIKRPVQTPAKPRRRRSGFTLIEVMIVVLIIGMLLNIAAPSFVHARDVGQQRACISNLHFITMAKEEFAIQTDKSGSYQPVWTELSPYVRPGTTPICPSRGDVYNYGTINTAPTCPYGGPTGLPHVGQ